LADLVIYSLLIFPSFLTSESLTLSTDLQFKKIGAVETNLSIFSALPDVKISVSAANEVYAYMRTKIRIVATQYFI
jgi:hypothetical protein